MKPSYSRWLTISLTVLLVLPSAAHAGPFDKKQTGGGFSIGGSSDRKKDTGGYSSGSSGSSSGWGSLSGGGSRREEPKREETKPRDTGGGGWNLPSGNRNGRDDRRDDRKRDYGSTAGGSYYGGGSGNSGTSGGSNAPKQTGGWSGSYFGQQPQQPKRQEPVAPPPPPAPARPAERERLNPIEKIGAGVGLAGAAAAAAGLAAVNSGSGTNSNSAQPTQAPQGSKADQDTAGAPAQRVNPYAPSNPYQQAQPARPVMPPAPAPAPAPRGDRYAPAGQISAPPSVSPGGKALGAGVVTGAIGVGAAAVAADAAASSPSKKGSEQKANDATQPKQAGNGKASDGKLLNNSTTVPLNGNSVIPQVGKVGQPPQPPTDPKAGKEVYRNETKVSPNGSSVIPSTGLPQATAVEQDRTKSRGQRAHEQQQQQQQQLPKTPAQMAAEAQAKWTVGTGAYSSDRRNTVSTSINKQGQIDMKLTPTEQKLRGKSELKLGRNEVVNGDGSKTVRYVDRNGRLLSVESYLKDGRLRERTTIAADGTRKSEYPISGKTATFTPDGRAVVNSPRGVQRDGYFDPNTGIWKFKRRYTDRRGRSYDYDYETRESQIGHQPIDVFRPHYRSSAEDYWYERWLEERRNSHSYGGYYSGGSSYSGAAPSFNNDREEIPRGVQAPSHIDIDWSKHFEVLPEYLKADSKMRYDDPVDMLADYVTLELVQENSDEVPGFLTRTWNRIMSLGKSNGTESLKVYKVDNNTRVQLGRQISEMATLIREHKEIDISGLFDAETGEIQKNEAGKQKQALFIVDRENVQEVKDSDTGRSCTLQVASMILPVSTTQGDEDKLVEAKVLHGGDSAQDCKVGTKVMVTATDLQEMNNDLAMRVERAMRTIPSIVKK